MNVVIGFANASMLTIVVVVLRSKDNSFAEDDGLL
jgi:hypothetical protein